MKRHVLGLAPLSAVLFLFACGVGGAPSLIMAMTWRVSPALRPGVLRSGNAVTRAGYALNSSQPILPSTATPAAIVTPCGSPGE